MKSIPTIGAFLSCAAITGGALAAVVEYTDTERDQWFADAGGPSNVSTVDFTGYPSSTLVTDQWEHLGIHFSGFVVTRGFSDFLFPNDGWGARGEPEINITFDAPVQWIAADFPGDIVVELYLQSQLFHTFQSPIMGGIGRFGGLISDQPFDAVRIFDPLDDLAFLDDLHFGPPIAVPAPSAGTIIMIAGALVGKRRRR